MVQAVENWCCVAGTIEQVDLPPPKSKGKPDQAILSVRIDRIMPVEGYPALLHPEDAPMVSVIVRTAQIGKVKPAGRHVAIPVRVAGPDRCFAHPDWSLAHGSAMCGPN